MGDRQIWYYIKEGVRSIFTHGLMSFAAVCMTVACLLIMGSFSLIAVNAGNILQDLEDENEFPGLCGRIPQPKRGQSPPG